MGPREHSLAPILSKLSSGSTPADKGRRETDVGIYSDGFFLSFFLLSFFFFFELADISKRGKIKERRDYFSQLLFPVT